MIFYRRTVFVCQLVEGFTPYSDGEVCSKMKLNQYQLHFFWKCGDQDFLDTIRKIKILNESSLIKHIDEKVD